VYVLDADRDPSVQRFDSRGNFEAQFADFGPGCYGPGCSAPTAIAVAPNGDVLVVEGAGTTVNRYSSTGTLEQTWGSEGSGPGQFACSAPISYCVDGPDGIAVGADGLVYVADTYNNRIEVFNGTGTFLRQWRTSIEQPALVATTPAGDVLVGGANYSTSGNSVFVYDNHGTLLDQFGSDNNTCNCQKPANDDGQLTLVSGLAIAPDGRVFTASQGADTTTSPVSLQEFSLYDSGRPAPGSLAPSDVYGHLTLTTTPARGAGCRFNVPGLPATVRDCTGFLRASASWTQGCRGARGVPSWGVALRYTSTTSDKPFYYRPTSFAGPVFAPGPPHEDTYGEWRLPDGTDLGPSDPRQRPVLAFGSQVHPVAGVRHHAGATIQPGVAVTATMRVQCTYTMSDGTTDSLGVDIDGNSVATSPRIVWDGIGRQPTRIPPNQNARIPIAVLYSTAPAKRKPTITFSATGAGVNTTRRSASAYLSLLVRPRRAGTLHINASIGKTRVAGELMIRVA
jgi:hypothetical protein